MGENTKIEWADHTANLWWGCTTVTQGCKNCYAAALSNRWGKDLWGNDKPREEKPGFFPFLERLQELAKKAGTIETVFVGSMMDIFEREQRVMLKGVISTNYTTANLRFAFFYRIDRGDFPNLFFLLLTKRPSNINKMVFRSWLLNPPSNVMFGTSISTTKDLRLAEQLMLVNGKRFLSIEPQIEEITLPVTFKESIHWIIQGGESGVKRRFFNTHWAYKMKAACNVLGIPYFFKQIDKKTAIPADLLVRQKPHFLISQTSLQNF